METDPWVELKSYVCIPKLWKKHITGISMAKVLFQPKSLSPPPPFITPSLHQPLDGFSFPFKPFSQEERRLDEKLFMVMTSMIIECLGYLIKVQHVIPLNFSILGVSGCNMFSNCWEYYNNCNSVLNFPKNYIRCINSTFKLNSLVHISICLVFFKCSQNPKETSSKYMEL